MEAITIGGLAAVAVGGYFSVMDFMNDLGIRRRSVVKPGTRRLSISRRCAVVPQTGIKKMAGMHI
jgi:hypothetical protein